MAEETSSNSIAQTIAAIATVILTMLGLAHVRQTFCWLLLPATSVQRCYCMAPPRSASTHA